MSAQISQATMRAHALKGKALYSSQQVYAMEQAWFQQGYSSFALMQQAAWQIAQRIIQCYEQRWVQSKTKTLCATIQNAITHPPRACIWVGYGNNGGDGWLTAHYLRQFGWQVKVITVGCEQEIDNHAVANELPAAKKAQQIALAAYCPYHRFEDIYEANAQCNGRHINGSVWYADVYIDALFGIGLNRAPTGIYQQAIQSFNVASQLTKALVIAIDMPSGLVASTGEVFEAVAIQADVTLCLIARKVGLHIKDGMDYAGEVLDVPLIPYAPIAATATLLNQPYNLSTRHQNSHKGSYGHVLIIGGNCLDGSQGMGGAAILAASSAMATGAGKITVACHKMFHNALVTSLPDAMSIALHDVVGVKNLIEECDVIAIGMGLGRDFSAQDLFIGYIQAAITHEKYIVIDADGLYHLAALHAVQHPLVTLLREYSQTHQVCLTPHSGETAKLLNKPIIAVEADRLAAIEQVAKQYGGDWVLKGAGSLILEQPRHQKSSPAPNQQAKIYVSATGNAGLATAGMGDILAGLIAGLLAQQDLTPAQRGLSQAVLIHGLAGDVLVDNNTLSDIQSQTRRYAALELPLHIGQRGLQAQDMPMAIRHVMHAITK